MINTSTEFKQAMEQNNVCIPKATILLKNGTQLPLDSTQIMQSGTKINDGTSGSNNFQIGSGITNKLTLSLNNMYDEFSDYDFTDAVITLWIGKQLSNHIEWLKKGVFNTSDPTTTPSVLTLECLDNMSKFDVVYDGNLSFPATLQTIVNYCCTKCGVLLYSGQFSNYSYSIQKNPFDEKSNVTYRALLSYCALLAGCYARCNVDGRLELKWYDTTAFDGLIDGGVFDVTTASSYQTGDSLDGGNFTDYSSGDSADGGTFTETLPYHHIYGFSSLSVSTEDVVITGIRVKASDGVDANDKKLDGETYLCGTDGYVLEVSGNPLIEYGKAKAVAEYLAGRIVGMRFRPMNASAVGDPSWEAGDAAIITDRKGNSYNCYLTNISYNIGNYATISCDAEPAARHSADRYGQIEQIVADIKKDSQQKISEYAKYVDQMNQLAINAMGYYETNEKQSDGSIITYMHDKPLIKDSTIVYKKTIDGFFISRDGGKTYVGGMDKDANIVANVIAAIGIRGDWVDADSITAKQLSVDYKNSVTQEIVDSEGEVKKWSESYITQTISTANEKITLGVSESVNALMHDYVINGDFASNLDGWTVSDSTIITQITQATLGKCVKYSGGSTSVYLRQYWKSMKSGKYKVRFKAATDSEHEAVARIRCTFDNASKYTTAGKMKSSEWTQFELEYDTTAAGGKYLYFYDYVSGAPIYIKDIELLGAYESYNEAQMVIMNNAIELKVTSDDVESIIEQSAESIRLKAGKISWESTYSSMTSSGVLKCSSAELKGTMKCGTDSGYWVQLASSGKLTGGYGGTQYGYIDYSASANNISTGATYHGIQIQGGCLRISVNELATRKTSNVGTVAYVGATGTVNGVTSIVDNGDGTITWHTSTMQYENGLLVTDI